MNRPEKRAERRRRFVVALALTQALLAACQLVETEPLSWDELVTVTATEFTPNPAVFFEEAVVTPQRLERLPAGLKTNESLAYLAISRALDEPVPYQKGVLGTVGTAKLFVARKADIPDYDRLWWVMVRVLSEKYGCFMRGRVRQGDVQTIRCKDTRQIVLWRSEGPDWIQFYARQFDAQGYEIEVRSRQIVRISTERLLGVAR